MAPPQAHHQILLYMVFVLQSAYKDGRGVILSRLVVTLLREGQCETEATF